MKWYKLFYISMLSVALIAVMMTGCGKEHFNINKNPNQPTDSTVNYDAILPAALHGTGAIVAGNWGWLQNWMGYWARSGSYAPSLTEETYTITTTFENNVWNDLYNNTYDYEVMLRKAKLADARFYEGIARIMKAHNFQMLVDVYGNIPYQQALKGNANITPAYDKGLDVYRDLLRQVDTGLLRISEATASQSRDIDINDIMFHGSKSLWAKFGNTLKLRMLVHLHNGVNTTQLVAGIDVPAEMAKIRTEGSGFLNTGESAEVQPGYRSDKPNPFYREYVEDENGASVRGAGIYRANRWGLEYYAFNADPRIGLFYSPVTSGFRGVEYGLPASNLNSGTLLSGIGTGLNQGAGRAQWIVTATESLFLQAEARQRGFLTTGPTAKELWTAAILENFDWLGSSATEGLRFVNTNAGTGYPDVDFNADPMYAILSQKWFSLNGIAPYEIWTDFRRTDIVYGIDGGYLPGPPISVAPQNTATRIPTRLLYPQTEYNYNATNVGKEGAVDRYGKTFWNLN